jgi:tagaturonate reductase
MFPETILQFGTGRFLRAFVDHFVHQANESGQNIGRIVVVQSTGDREANLLNATQGRFHVVVRGLQDGQTIDRVDTVASISRAIAAAHDWNGVLAVATSPVLRFIISNTTEAGYTVEPGDRIDRAPPNSFPLKLLAILGERFRAGLPGVTIIPCELRDQQADELFGIVRTLAEQSELPAAFRDWMTTECVWLNTLVDRIVVGAPKDHPLSAEDPLLIMAEPFSFFALQDKPGARPFVVHPNIVRAADVRPYFLRKVRILNAAHTALVTKAIPKGYQTVIEAMGDVELASWLERLLVEEIVPTLDDRVDGPLRFAQQTLERFRNPFLEHRLVDIYQNHELKRKVRLEPTRVEFVTRFGRRPPLLDELLGT